MATAFQDLEERPEAKRLQHREWLAVLLELSPRHLSGLVEIGTYDQFSA
jgi:hypothetical protein